MGGPAGACSKHLHVQSCQTLKRPTRPEATSESRLVLLTEPSVLFSSPRRGRQQHREPCEHHGAGI
eukprot:15451919-Alexandrium_andersonii.AAC.1